MSIIEDFVLRKMYLESKNLLEIDLFTPNSFGRTQIKSDVDIEDLYAVVIPELMGLNILEQRLFDDIMADVLEDPKVRFGFSLACAKAAASYLGLPLYQYLGGLYNLRLPKIVFGESIVDDEFQVIGKASNLRYLNLDTLTELSQNDRTSCLKFVEDGSWHIACGLSFEYLEIYKKEDINELIRIKEYMSEV